MSSRSPARIVPQCHIASTGRRASCPLAVERKPGIYASLGVKEYFLFDPTGEHLSPRLQGYRLVDGAYERLTAVESIDRTLTLHSEALGLELRAKGEEVRFHDPATGETLLSYAEEHAARREEAAARRAAEARIAELEARLSEYGVVIVESGDDGARVLDLPATEDLRGRMRAAVIDGFPPSRE